jgi:hypothetical protein
MVYGIGNHGGIIVFGHPYYRNESFVQYAFFSALLFFRFPILPFHFYSFYSLFIPFNSYTLDHGATQQVFQITNPYNLSMAVTGIFYILK